MVSSVVAWTIEPCVPAPHLLRSGSQRFLNFQGAGGIGSRASPGENVTDSRGASGSLWHSGQTVASSDSSSAQ